MANTIYNNATLLILDGNSDLSGSTIKLMILNNTYTPSATEDYISEVSSKQVSGTGYTAGGYTLSNVTVTESSGTSKFDADNISVNPVTFTNGRWGIVYIDSGTPATSPMLVALDFGADKSPVAEPLAINFSASGILTLAKV